MIGRKSFLALISHIVVQICNGIVYFTAVKKFLPLQFGYYQIAGSIILIFSLLSTLGFADTHVKIIAEKKNIDEAFTTYAIIKIIIIIFSAFITSFIVFFQATNGLISNDKEQLWIILIVGISNLFIAISSIYNLSFRGTLKFAKLELPIMIGTICGAIFSLISILIFENFLLYLISLVLTNVIILILYINFGKSFHFTHINFSLIKRYLFLSIPFLIPILLLNLRKSLGPLLFLQFFDEELLGVYSIITSFFSMLVILEKSFIFVLVPSFTQLISDQNSKKLKDSINLFSKYMLIINGIVIIAGVIFAEVFLKYILGQFYFEKGLFFFYGSLLTLLIFPLMIPYSALIIATEKMKMYITVEILFFVFSLISWIFFIPQFNIVGIELGAWIALIPNIIILRLYCIKHFSVDKLKKHEFWNVFMIFILIFFSLFASSKQLPFFFNVLTFLIIIGCYIVFLLFAKIIDKRDIRYILDNINPKKMINYIQEETMNDKN
ncbi:hypothetical protein LCGC14_0965240 [marine sediment metagenome]|uniref:Polysaccharide biosynthesis protein C-terminal domain-containing protein n=1 Tax=marine sediment metagenome TaxID=412755 RepID=A0A0F9NHS0_9ZZZZ